MRIVKRSLLVAGLQTSVSLEASFWAALGDIAEREAVSVAQLIDQVASTRDGAPLSSALRTFVLHDARRRAHHTLMKRRTVLQ
jgi:predicted DNA-binding ribbon-helix-helix protein